MKKDYEAPTIRELGSLAQLTAQPYNKVGANPDTYSQVTPEVIGSLVPAP